VSAQFKVTIVVGGRWHAFDLARGLNERGALHRLVTSYPRFKAARWGIPKDKIVSLTKSQWLDQAVRRVGRGNWDVHFQHIVHSVFAEEAARYIEGADIVHAWSSFAAPSVALCRARGVPIVVERGSSHMRAQIRLLTEELARLDIRRRVTHPRVAEMELFEYSGATKIAIPSTFVRSTFLEEGVPEQKLFQNSLGVNLAHFTPGDELPARHPFTAIYAGSMTYRKGVHYLTEAFRRARLQGGTLVLVGNAAPETRHLIGQATDGVERVSHVPQRELVNHYRRAHVFVIASIEEGMAMVQAQALACGLPLICTTNTGGEDLLRHLQGVRPPSVEGRVVRYAAGFVVPIRDADAIAYCLRRLADDRALWVSQRAAALGIRGADLDWNAYTERLLALYRSLITATR
jgi:starch synthase